MTDKVQKIRQEVARIQAYTQSDVLKEVLDYIDKVQEEPKFKTGDHIKPIDSSLGAPRTILEVCDGWYVTNQGTLDFEFEDNWELVEQNPAWSEEDEDMRYKATAVINRLCAEGKDYVWSVNTLEKLFYWLKSLKERYTWKPSDEQMEALVSAIDVMIDNIGAGDKDTILLSGLYHELKKLREESL